jgi:hypothetical protein
MDRVGVFASGLAVVGFSAAVGVGFLVRAYQDYHTSRITSEGSETNIVGESYAETNWVPSQEWFDSLTNQTDFISRE